MQASSYESSPPGSPSPLSVFLGHLEQIDAGEAASLDALCDQHPQIAGELRNLWSDFEGTSRVFLDARSELFVGVLDLLRRHDAGAAPAVAGQRLSRYEVGAELARGGIGVVFEAQDVELGRPVALKFLHDQWLHEPGFLERFTKEAQLGGRLQHPGIPPVYEFVRDGARPFLSMKLIEGHTFSEELRGLRDRLAALPRLLRIYEAVCQTVAYVHSHDVIHRDLKPSNVMIGEFGEVQIVDWGMAKVLSGRAAGDSQAEVLGGGWPGRVPGAGDTEPGSRLGTPAYMSPEQAGAGSATVDQRADVFSLGAILCEILTGEPPYVSDESGSAKSADLLAKAAAACLGFARERLREADVPAALSALSLQCMAGDPERRPRDAAALARCVREYLEDVEARARRAEVEAATVRVRARATRRFLRWLGVALVIAVALLIIAWSNWRRAESLKWQRQLDAGRSTARLGDLQYAEELLWDLYRTQPEDEDLRWALRELYARNPTTLCWRAHEAPVSLMASALGGTLVATAGSHGVDRQTLLRVWDVSDDASPPSAQLRAEWVEPRSVRCLTLSGDGRSLFASSWDGAVVEYPLAPAGEPILHCGPGEEPPVALSSWDEDRSLALFRAPSTGNSEGSSVEIWSRAVPGTLVRRLPAVRVSDLTTRDGELWVLTADGVVVFQPGAGAAEAALCSADLAPAGVANRRFVGSASELLVATPNARQPTVAITRLTREEGRPQQVADWNLQIRKNHGLLLANSGFLFEVRKPDDRTLHLYQLEAQGRAAEDLDRRADVWRAPARITRLLSLRPGRIATGLEDGSVRVWRVPASSPRPGTLLAVSWNRTGDTLAIAWGGPGHGGAAAVPRDRLASDPGWAVGSPRRGPVSCVAFHPRRDLLACAGSDGRIDIVESGRCPLPVICAPSISYIAFDDSGELLGVAHDGGVTLLRTTDWQVARQLLSPGSFFKCVQFLADGRVIACGASRGGGGWLVWDPASTSPPQAWDIPQPVSLRAMAQSKDGRIAIGGDDGVIRLCTADGIETGVDLVGHSGSVYALAFHPTSPQPLLASADSLGEIRLWDVATGKVLCILRDHLPDPPSGVFCLAFSPDGALLVSAGELRYPVVFDLAELDRLVAANGSYQRQLPRGR